MARCRYGLESWFVAARGSPLSLPQVEILVCGRASVATCQDPGSWQPAGAPSPCHRSRSWFVAARESSLSLPQVEILVRGSPRLARNPGSWQPTTCHRSKSLFVAARGSSLSLPQVKILVRGSPRSDAWERRQPPPLPDRTRPTQLRVKREPCRRRLPSWFRPCRHCHPASAEPEKCEARRPSLAADRLA